MPSIGTTHRNPVEFTHFRSGKPPYDMIQLTVLEMEDGIFQHWISTLAQSNFRIVTDRLDQQRATVKIIASGPAQIPTLNIRLNINQRSGQNDISAPRFESRDVGRLAGDDQSAVKVQNRDVSAQRLDTRVTVALTSDQYVTDGRAIQLTT